MKKVGIQLYRNKNDNRQGIQLDVACILMRLFQEFPQIQFEEEYFQSQVERIKSVVANKLSGSSAIHSAMTDAEERGPGFRFSVPSPDGHALRGSLARYSLSFLIEDGIDSELKKRAELFVESFEVVKFAE
jgi:hypothetical protein